MAAFPDASRRYEHSDERNDSYSGGETARPVTNSQTQTRQRAPLSEHVVGSSDPTAALPLAGVLIVDQQVNGKNMCDKSFSDFDKRQNAYWTDIHKKLTAIKEQLNNN